MPLTPAQQKEIKALVASGERIAAVKRFREITGVGLNEALQAVTAIADGSWRESTAAAVKGLATRRLDPKAQKSAEAAAMAAVREGRSLDAVKAYRQHTGLGLKDSKDAVDVLTLVHHSNGRLNAKVAKAVFIEFAAGRKREALEVLTTGAGYDEEEARAFLRSLGRLGVARSGCARGCLFAAVAMVVLIAAVTFWVTRSL